MKKPVIGQVLATNRGDKFLVEDVFSTYDADEEYSTPEDFAVQLAPVEGLHVVETNWEMEAMLHFEFDAWCKRNGVSY